MNERIKQLIEQVTETHSIHHEGYRGKGYTEYIEFFDKERFAELIVKECANIAMREDHDPAECIKKHFGVE